MKTKETERGQRGKMKKGGLLCRSQSHSVASPGIEPGSGASETLILSIVLQGPCKGRKVIISLPFPVTIFTFISFSFIGPECADTTAFRRQRGGNPGGLSPP